MDKGVAVAATIAATVAINVIILVFIVFSSFLTVFSPQAVLECCLETRGIVGETPSKSLQPNAQLFLNRFSTGR